MFNSYIIPTTSVVYQAPGQVYEHHLEAPLSVVEEHLVPRPIEVCQIEKVEESWREKAKSLEREYVSLMLEYQESRLANKPERRTTFYKGKNVQFQDSKIIQEIQKLEEDLKNKDQELNNLEEVLNLHMDEYQQQTIAKGNQDDEVKQAKQQFQQLNKRFHEVQERLELVRTEIEGLKTMGTQQREIVKSIHVMNIN